MFKEEDYVFSLSSHVSATIPFVSNALAFVRFATRQFASRDSSTDDLLRRPCDSKN
jgi:hypothetical protein